MAEIIPVKIKNRIDTSANLTSDNPVLLSGEIGFESDTLKMKIGDGSTAWNSLVYAYIPSTGGTFIGDVKADKIISESTSPSVRLKDLNGNILYNQIFLDNDGSACTLKIKDDVGVTTYTPLLIFMSTGLTQMQGVYDNTSASAPNVFVNAAGGLLRSTSSLRYKEELKQIEEEVDTTKIFDIDLVTFKSKTEDEETKRYVGTTAESVHDTLGEKFCTYDENNLPDAVQYDRLVLPLIAEVKKLKAEIELLKAK